jgi:hypothetical protein
MLRKLVTEPFPTMSLEKVGGAKSSGAVLLIGESYTDQHQIINVPITRI